MIIKRKFSLVGWSPTFGRILYRSPGDHKDTINLDIVFIDTKYINAPTQFELESIKEVTQLDEGMNFLSNNKIAALEQDLKVFELSTKTQKFYIVASFISMFENKLELLELPFEKDKTSIKSYKPIDTKGL
ncbi:MAG: hypothetical protein ABI721_01105 [Candidatus Dojkabacteria bacterium]